MDFGANCNYSILDLSKKEGTEGANIHRAIGRLVPRLPNGGGRRGLGELVDSLRDLWGYKDGVDGEAFNAEGKELASEARKNDAAKISKGEVVP
eukprot:g8943.t1